MGNQVNDLLGRPLRDLRISVTDRCNFRCTYCMPSEIFGEKYHFLNREEVLSYEEIKRLTKALSELGVCKIRLTGGEPTVRKDFFDIIKIINVIFNSMMSSPYSNYSSDINSDSIINIFDIIHNYYDTYYNILINKLW